MIVFDESERSTETTQGGNPVAFDLAKVLQAINGCVSSGFENIDNLTATLR
jgi:hypothetical protein